MQSIKRQGAAMPPESLLSAISRSIRRFANSILTDAFPEIRTLHEVASRTATDVRKLTDLVLYYQTKQLQSDHPNPLNKFGRKCFSQTDEDGITLEILARIGLIGGGTFAEFGVGDGTENNTLILAALGWKGFWIGGEDLAVRHTASERFIFLKSWITLDNILDSTTKGLSHLRAANLDVVSMDLDGNDIYFAEKLLSNKIKPKLFIVEYNAKFPPPVEFRIAYDPEHTWKHDDYFGASLSSFVKLFSTHGYRLICCNAHTGANAFFIDSIYEGAFTDIPSDIGKIYVEPRYILYNNYGHEKSKKLVEAILSAKFD